LTPTPTVRANSEAAVRLKAAELTEPTFTPATLSVKVRKMPEAAGAPRFRVEKVASPEAEVAVVTELMAPESDRATVTMSPVTPKSRLPRLSCHWMDTDWDAPAWMVEATGATRPISVAITVTWPLMAIRLAVWPV